MANLYCNNCRLYLAVECPPIIVIQPKIVKFAIFAVFIRNSASIMLRKPELFYHTA